MKKIIYILLGTLFLVTSCGKMRMAEVNTDSSVVDEPQLEYLFSDALLALQKNAYTEWFYDNTQYIMPWMQITVGNSGGSNGADFNQMGAQGYRYGVFYDQLGGPAARIQHIIENTLSEYESASFENLKALTYILQIYYGIRVTDIVGYMPYTEALQGFYTNPPMLTPVFDSQESLLTLWDNQLEEAISMLTDDVVVNGEVVTQVKLSSQQDFVYGGNVASWIMLANSLRLRIAVRLLVQDESKALEIAEEVSADGRIMNSIDDEFYWYGGEQFYNFNDGIWYGLGAQNFIDYMRDNLDPRLRFTFSKNDFNSMVVQGFLNQNVDIPSYILENADIDYSGDTPKFVGWKGEGEPWVRYYGAPVTVAGEIPSEVENEYFQTSRFQLSIGSSLRTFYPVSFFSTNAVQPNKWYTYPDTVVVSEQYKPDGNYPYRLTMVSAAETQFYLAELKTLGANISSDAQTLFSNGVTLSVESLNRAARDLNLPEYSEPYDATYGKAIALVPGEITTLLENPNYMLTGDQTLDLEKIRINLIIDRLLTPSEIFVTCRRTGIPYTNSTLWAREDFSAAAYPIPRRFVASEPAKSDINYENTMKAYTEQGFTVNTNLPSVLNSERLWYDIGAPDYGSAN